MMIVCGIDNGFNGGIAMIYPGGRIEARKMPIIETVVRKKTKREYDLLSLFNTFYEVEPDMVFLEAAQAFPGQGGVSNFKTGLGFGLMQGMLRGMGIKFEIVRPKAWQKVMFAGLEKQDTKRISAIMCAKLWPDVCFLASSRCGKPHDGMTDAAMIAEYGRRKLEGEVT